MESKVPVGRGPRGLAFDGGAIWVSNFFSNTVNVININSNSVGKSINVGSRPTGVVYDGEWIWVANQQSHNVTRIYTLLEYYPINSVGVGLHPDEIAFDGTHIWVTSASTNFVGKFSALPLARFPAGIPL
jgi:YVTN family beta-propeller protein